MRRTVTFALALGLAALLAGGPGRGDDKKGQPDEKAYMEAMMKAATPGEHHKKLDALVGSWDLTVTMWMDPAKPPVESKATAESKWIMGDRYLQEKVTGEFGGMTFLGEQVTGYDNLKKKYVASWIDNMGTGISTSTGSYDADKHTFTYHGEETDPLTGQQVKGKSVVHVIDKDKYELDYYKDMGGKDVKVMHIACTRKAAR